MLRRLSPEPFSPLKRAPRSAAKRFTTEIPAAVDPAPPNSPPMSLSSISAKKLFEGTFVSWIRSAMVGEPKSPTWFATGGTTPGVTLLPIDTPSLRSASWKRRAALFAGSPGDPPSTVSPESVPIRSALIPC